MARVLVVDAVLVAPGALAISPLERGFQYGDGLFETIAVRGDAALEPERHLARMSASAKALGMPPPPPDLWNRSLAACLAAGTRLAGPPLDTLRVTWTRGLAGRRGFAPSETDGPPRMTAAGYSYGWDAVPEGVTATTVHGLAPGELARHKTTSAIAYVTAAGKAREAGTDTALLVSDRGLVLEATGSNVFLVREGRVLTPPATRPILAGIGRERVLGWLGRDAAEADFTPDELAHADEAFLTNAVRGVVPLVRVDGHAIGDGAPGPRTRELEARWESWAAEQATVRTGPAGTSSAWITRRQIRVNRTATCWLVRRFLAPDAQFVFVEPDEVAGREASLNGTGFDAPGARYPHKDANGRCSFAALVHEHLAHDAALVEMARIVQAADFEDQLDDHPAARGLVAISRGFPLVAEDDHDTVARAAFLYDSMYEGLVARLARA
jgi:branched-subunit amino acid aminotransferase/4-amino-4-deoxychorismate lyase